MNFFLKSFRMIVSLRTFSRSNQPPQSCSAALPRSAKKPRRVRRRFRQLHRTSTRRRLVARVPKTWRKAQASRRTWTRRICKWRPCCSPNASARMARRTWLMQEMVSWTVSTRIAPYSGWLAMPEPASSTIYNSPALQPL